MRITKECRRSFVHNYEGQFRNTFPFLWHTSTFVSANVRNDLIYTTTTKCFPTSRQSLQKAQFQVMHVYLLQAEIIIKISRSEHPHLVLCIRPDATSKKWVQVLLFWLTVLGPVHSSHFSCRQTFGRLTLTALKVIFFTFLTPFGDLQCFSRLYN